jgi:hypothetical protein
MVLICRKKPDIISYKPSNSTFYTVFVSIQFTFSKENPQTSDIVLGGTFKLQYVSDNGTVTKSG